MAMKNADGENDGKVKHQTDERADNMADDQVAPLAQRFLWVDTERGLNRLIVGLMVVCAVLFLLDFIIHRHIKVPGEELYGFHAIVGFASFTVVVMGAKMLRLVIRRNENYYGDSSVDNEAYPESGTQKLTHASWSGDSVADLKDQMLGTSTTGSQATDELAKDKQNSGNQISDGKKSSSKSKPQ